MRIMFVCTGNTCRSCMAEAIAGQWLAENGPDRQIQVTSAGMAAWSGSPASRGAIEALAAKGIDLKGHRARLFDYETAAAADLVLTMTTEHKNALLAAYPELTAKIHTLAEFAGRPLWPDVADPIGQDRVIYDHCAGEIEELVAGALHKILEQAQ